MEIIVATAHRLAPGLHIVARAATREGAKELADLGARELERLVHAMHDLELGWATVAPESIIKGRSLADANLRARCGVSVVAITQGGEVTTNPGPATMLETGARVALIGTPSQLAAGELLLHPAI